MAQDIKLSPAGLWTAPAVLEAPPGALSVAKEIILRRQGMAQPRPGFSQAQDLSSEPALLRLIAFQDNFLKVLPGTPLTEWSGGTDVTNEASGALTWLDDAISGVEARKNLYLTTSDVLRKVSSTSDTVAYQTGAPVPAVYAVISASNGNAVEGNSYVGYTALTRRQDANDLVVRSGVSGRYVIFNTVSTTLTKQVTVTLALHPDDDFRVGDTIEVYRTFSELTIPPDEGYLVKEIAIDSSILAAGGTSFTDNTLDLDLGAALYTNESREGIAANHIRPPFASSAELFNGSLFLSDLKFPAEQIISWSPGGTDANGSLVTSSATQIGQRVFTGDFTNGSNQILNVTPTTGLQIGQIINNIGNEWATDTQYVRITAISGGTVTMSQNYDGSTGAGKTRAFYDSIRIDGRYFVAYNSSAFVLSVRGQEFNVSPSGEQAAVSVTANGIGDVGSNTTALHERRYVQIIATKPSITPPVIYATHGDQYEPPLPLPTATGLTLDQEIQAAGIMWSNNQEPEHFQIPNIDLIGGQTGRVMTMRAAKNALLAFKEDGLWRVSGAGAESGFRFDQHNADVRLLYSAATAVVGTKVYAWCDQGVFECDEIDCLDISGPAIKDVLEPLQRAIGSGSRTAHGAWACSNRKDREFILSVPTTSVLTEGERLYVFNQETGTWVNWFVGGELKHATTYFKGTTTGKLILVNDQYVLQERDVNSGDLYGVDTTYNVTVSAVSGADLTINSSSWTPVVGDLFTKGGLSYLVIAVTDATHFTVHTTGVTTGAGQGHVAFTSEIAWIANTAKNPGLLKSWGEGTLWWSSLYGMRSYTQSFTSSLSSSAVTMSKSLTTGRISSVFAEAFRFATPRNHARTTRLYPKVSIRQGGSAWQIDAISLGYMYMSDRVRSN